MAQTATASRYLASVGARDDRCGKLRALPIRSSHNLRPRLGAPPASMQPSRTRALLPLADRAAPPGQHAARVLGSNGQRALGSHASPARAPPHEAISDECYAAPLAARVVRIYASTRRAASGKHALPARQAQDAKLTKAPPSSGARAASRTCPTTASRARGPCLQPALSGRHAADGERIATCATATAGHQRP